MKRCRGGKVDLLYRVPQLVCDPVKRSGNISILIAIRSQQKTLRISE